MPHLTPVVVCGTARSGTTLLLRLLDGHPALLVMPTETQLFQGLANRRLGRWIMHAAELTDRYEWMGVLTRPRLWPLTFRGPDALARRLAVWTAEYPHSGGGGDVAGVIREETMRAGGRPDRYPAVFLEVFERIVPADRSRARFWVEKTPMNERYAAVIDRWSRGTCHFVHTIRDPRDVVASSLPMIDARTRRQWSREHRLVHVCYQWSRSVEWRRHNARVFSGRYHLVRYEDLVRNPYDVVTEILGFLGLEPHPTASVPTRFGERIAANSSYRDFKDTDDVAESQIRRHREALTEDEIGRVETLLRGQMRACGYVPSTRGSAELPRTSTGNKRADLRASVQAWKLLRTQRVYERAATAGAVTS